ncbi:hypothetical protein SD81_028485 [Tolypothrix campylonemoides VB511288]|nr:hypothetical protein SD81_028485 [Tolypothrix campylonemoides VB511288]
MRDGRTEKVTFTCTPEMKEYLVNWASDDRRSISNLVEGLVAEAINQRQANSKASALKQKDKGVA